jgi:hypothetical protein
MRTARENRQAHENRQERPRRGRRWPRRLAVAVAVVAVLVAIVGLALDPLVTWRTRVVLNDLEGYRGRFNDVKVSVRDLSYRIEDLRLEKTSAGGAALPFFEVREAEVGLYWKELVRGHFVAAIRFMGPKLNLVSAKDPAERQGAGEGRETQAAGLQLTKLAPIRVDRFEVKEGEILFVDRGSPRDPRLWLHDIEATIENFATRPALARGEPTVLAARGTLQRTGKVSLFATSDPLAKKVTFAGQAQLRGLKLVELGELLADKSGLTPTGGELDLSARFTSENGVISGGVKPVLKDASVKAGKPGLGPKLKALVADVSLDLFSDDIPGRDAVATIVPIKGKVDAPQVQAVPTILGIVRNAFVAGLTNSLSNLPPPTAEKKQGTLEQARRAVTGRGPPRAQPTRKDE